MKAIGIQNHFEFGMKQRLIKECPEWKFEIDWLIAAVHRKRRGILNSAVALLRSRPNSDPDRT
jgi:hypothetical protein